MGEQAESDGVHLCLLSLELYDDGFLLNWRSQLKSTEERVGFGRIGPRDTSGGLAVNVTDDRGNTYRPWPYGSGGSAYDFRWHIALAPAVDPLARLLRIEVPGLRLTRFAADAVSEATEGPSTGPWSFEIKL